MSYHKLKIHKHHHNSPYKIQEEFNEYIDSLATNNKVMAIQELSDLYGVIENEAEKFNLTMNDLAIMSNVTKQVFESGYRQSNDSLYDYLFNNHDRILDFGLGFIQVKCDNINYHFYTNKIKKFNDSDVPHNHSQDFVSEIITGNINETVFTKEGEISKTYKQGDLYLRLKDEYHVVSASNNTITKVTKYGNKGRVFVGSKEVDCGCNNSINDNEIKILWQLVKDICEVNNV